MPVTVTSIDGDTIETVMDRQHYGRQSSDLLDAILWQDGNEHLFSLGISLPRGTKLIMPDIDDEPEVKTLNRIQELWD